MEKKKKIIPDMVFKTIEKQEEHSNDMQL